MKKSVITTGIIVVVVVGATLGFGWSPSAKAAGDAGGDRVDTFEVRRGELVVTLTEQGTLVAKESKEVKPESDRSSKITFLIDEGSMVKEGDVLAKLDTKELEKEVEQLELDIVQAETSLDKAKTDLEIQKTENLTSVEKAQIARDKAVKELERYREGDAKQERRKLEIAIKDAETEFSRKKKIYDDSVLLVEQKYIKPIELEDARLSFEKAQVTKEGADLDLALFEKYSYPMAMADKDAALRQSERELQTVRKRNDTKIKQAEVTLQQAEKRLTKLKTRLEERKEDLGKMTLKAPVPGIAILGDPKNPWMRSEIKVGNTVWRGTTIFTIPDLRTMQVKLKIHEADVSKLKAGQTVKISTDTYAGVILDGEVTKIANIAGTTDRWGDNTEVKVFDVEVTIADMGELNLKPGISATAEIFIDTVADTVFVPLQSVALEEGKHYCFVVGEDGAPTKREVEPGIANDNYIAIQNGVEPGEEVLLYNPSLPSAKDDDDDGKSTDDDKAGADGGGDAEAGGGEETASGGD